MAKSTRFGASMAEWENENIVSLHDHGCSGNLRGPLRFEMTALRAKVYRSQRSHMKIRSLPPALNTIAQVAVLSW